MSRIDELIAEHCPDGVPYVGVTEVADYIRGITYNKGNEELDGSTRVLRANNITLSSNTLNLDNVKHVSESVKVRDNQRLYAGDILICAGSGSKDHIGKVAYIFDDMEETFGGFMGVIRSKGNLDARYLFHILTSDLFLSYLRSALSTTTINNLNSRVMKGFVIPVPPLEVQREIVRILDTFSKMEAELEAELEARKQQYDFYRDLAFENASPRDKWVPLGSKGRFERGSSVQKKDLKDDGVPCFHYGQVYTHYGVKTAVTKSFVAGEFAKNKRVLNPGDVFVATTSENEEDLGKAVAWLGDVDAVASSDAYIFRSEFDARYVSYFFSSSHFHTQKKRFITGTKVKRISGGAMEKMDIPNIPLVDQEQIASMLDKFDALVNDLSVGLPAELAARRQQYEYYRDKLLSFKELESSS